MQQYNSKMTQILWIWVERNHDHVNLYNPFDKRVIIVFDDSTSLTHLHNRVKMTQPIYDLFNLFTWSYQMDPFTTHLNHINLFALHFKN